MSGLPPAIFNADILLKPDWFTVIVEGEKKAMVLQQHNFDTVGLPGKNIFKDKWIKLFENCNKVFIVLDPDADIQAEKICKTLRDAKLMVKVVSLPVKPDDFFVLHGGTEKEFFQFLMMGK